LNSKILMGLAALLVLSVASLGVIAYQGNPDIKGPNYNEDVHEQLEAAMEARDYDLWVSIREENNLPSRGKIFSVLNEDNFEKFVEMHEANEAGDIETSNAIRAELGLGQGMRSHGGSGNKGNGQGMGQASRGSCAGGNYIDSDGDGNCDNLGMMGRGRN
jgi:hypothetical protein